MAHTILAVDDDQNFRDGLRRLLRSEGLSVVTAEDGAAALEVLRTQSIDVVLSDLQMPRMSGFELLTKLKADEELQHVPVIMLSGRDEIESVTECIKHGADDYINKPFNHTVLMTRVRSSLERKLSHERERLHLQNITEQKQQVELLLQALFPPPVIEELKLNKIVQPQRFEKASVLFIDVVGFTQYCSNREPEEVHKHLQAFVSTCETISSKHNMQKIKTIGDAFMCVGGLWDPGEDFVNNATQCALELASVVPTLGCGWQVRAGIHVGSLIAGIVGLQRYQFDVWGNTVNVASRIQACSAPGTVMVSDDVLNALPPGYNHEGLGTFNLKGLNKMNLHIIRSSSEPLLK